MGGWGGGPAAPTREQLRPRRKERVEACAAPPACVAHRVRVKAARGTRSVGGGSRRPEGDAPRAGQRWRYRTPRPPPLTRRPADRTRTRRRRPWVGTLDGGKTGVPAAAPLGWARRTTRGVGAPPAASGARGTVPAVRDPICVKNGVGVPPCLLVGHREPATPSPPRQNGGGLPRILFPQTRAAPSAVRAGYDRAVDFLGHLVARPWEPNQSRTWRPRPARPCLGQRRRWRPLPERAGQPRGGGREKAPLHHPHAVRIIPVQVVSASRSACQWARGGHAQGRRRIAARPARAGQRRCAGRYVGGRLRRAGAKQWGLANCDMRAHTVNRGYVSV